MKKLTLSGIVCMLSCLLLYVDGRISPAPQSLYLHDGSPIAIFSCGIVANEDYTIIWRFENRFGNYTREYRLGHSGGGIEVANVPYMGYVELRIFNVTLEHSGKYTCIELFSPEVGPRTNNELVEIVATTADAYLTISTIDTAHCMFTNAFALNNTIHVECQFHYARIAAWYTNSTGVEEHIGYLLGCRGSMLTYGYYVEINDETGIRSVYQYFDFRITEVLHRCMIGHTIKVLNREKGIMSRHRGLYVYR